MQNIRKRIALLILGFTAASVIGWLCEEICVYLVYGSFYKRGLLHLTLCPIYGFGACGIWLLLRRVQSTAVFLVSSAAIAGIFEYVCSIWLERVFHRSFWDYKGWLFSFQDRVSLLSCIWFSLLALVFVRAVLPLLRGCIRRGNDRVFLAGSLCIAAVILGDFLLTVFR